MAQKVRAAPPATPPRRLLRMPTWLIYQLGLRSSRLIDDCLDRPRTRADFNVLAALEEFGAMSQIELGRRLGLDRSDVAVVLDRLEAHHLVTRAPDGHDRRRNVIISTPAGQRDLNDQAARFQAAQEALLAPLTTAEGAQLVVLLQRLLEHHITPVGATVQAETVDAQREPRSN